MSENFIGVGMETKALIKFFTESHFIPELKSNNQSDILEELVEPLVDSGRIKSRDLLLDVLRKRETLGSTGIGKGIAVPHCRSLSAQELFIVVGISKKGVEYKAVDGKKVQLFFLIVAPPQDKSNEYLPVLGKIVELVRDTKIRRAILKSTDFTSFIDSIGGG